MKLATLKIKNGNIELNFGTIDFKFGTIDFKFGNIDFEIGINEVKMVYTSSEIAILTCLYSNFLMLYFFNYLQQKEKT